MSAPRVPAIAVDDVSKSFRLPREHVHTLKERVLHPLRRTGYDELKALRGVSFAVEEGEFFGIVGRNGSGKSTLLKCLGGIYRADAGRIYVNGRIATFIELGVGFNPDLAAYDNVVLNATMLGLSGRAARRRYDQVMEFAELGEFADLKLKNYSSGMLVRLAFSVLIQVDAEILLIDEVLAVGDAAFQQKCWDEFSRIRRSGTTVLLVTHDMSAVRRFCDRAVLLEHGKIVEIGDPETIGNRYYELNFSEDARAEEAGEPAPAQPSLATPEKGSRFTDGRAEITEAYFENDAGRRTTVLPTGRSCTFVLRARFLDDVDDPLFGVELHAIDDPRPAISISSLWTDPHAGRFAAGEDVEIRFAIENVLGPDRYEITAAVAIHGGWIDHYARFASVTVTGTANAGAYCEPQYSITVEHGTAREAVSS
jgi:ABC-2 type transport system ATP-binding protein